MPYDSLEDLPEEVQELSKEAQEVWMEAYNSAFDFYKDESPAEREGRSAATAWSAVRKAGFKEKGDINHSMSSALVFSTEKKFKAEQTKEGMLFRDAVLFSEGEWTDFFSKMTVKYKKEDLKDSIGLWKDLDLWSNMHTDDRRMTDHIGKVVEARMDGGKIKGDLLLHGSTQASRDAIEMWQKGHMLDLSSEMLTDDVEEDEKLIATNIRPTGVAWVDKGACDICKVAMRAPVEVEKALKKDKGGKSMAEDKDDSIDEKMEKLQAQVDALKKENKELKKKLQDEEDKEKEKDEKKEEQSPCIEDMTEQVEKLEKTVEEKDKEMAQAAEDFEKRLKALENIEDQKSKKGHQEAWDEDSVPKSYRKTREGLTLTGFPLKEAE